MLKRTLCLRQWRHCLSHSRYCAPRFQCNLPSRQAACRRTYASISAAELHFGQPVHETHSHILEPGECLYTLHRYSHLYKTICVTNAGKIVTPGITALEYAQRRSRLANRLPKNAIAVLAAAEIKYRAPGIFYEYHQDADFFYLTGFTEPGALAIIGERVHCDGWQTISDEECGIIANDGSGDNHVFHLYVREKDRKVELWEGARSGTQAAVDVFNADEVGPRCLLHEGNHQAKVLSVDR
jgi:intermediate cleaving peptidase 55